MQTRALLQRVEGALQGRSPRAVLAAKSFATGGLSLRLAEEGLAALRAGREPSAAALSAVRGLLAALRPAYEVDAGWPDHPSIEGVFPGWRRALPELRELAAGVVRVDSPRGDHLGTAFLLEGGLLATAGHVADEITRLLPQGEATCWSPTLGRIGIGAVVTSDPNLDLALLQPAKPLSAPPTRLAVAPTPPAWLVVIGFPGLPGRREDGWLWEGPTGVLRASPGTPAGRWDLCLEHDATTLGGSSGSPVWDAERRAVVGVHTSSVPGVRNVARPAASLGALMGGAP